MFNANNQDGALADRPQGRLKARQLAPTTDWGEMGETDHFVQFYESDDSLLNSLSSYIGMGLSMNDACIVVATPPHRESLDKRLEDFGLDVFAARASAQYVQLDAAEMLSQFMEDGVPDAGRFAEMVGSLLMRANGTHRRVRVFGEMVALLWGQDNTEAALRLEALWNDLRKTHHFVLYCAYPMAACAGEALADPVKGVCASHSRVIPAESYAALPDADERLRAIIELQQKAATLEAEITERRQAEAALRAVKDELEIQVAEAKTANRMKDEFLATVSHELRTPLNAIIGWSHLLRRGGLDEAMAGRAVETIERNARAQVQLVEDLLDVSRVITGKLQLKIGSVDLTAVINAALDAVQLAASSKGIRLEVTLDPSARHIAGDASRLQQVIWNLLSNAIKFTPAGGRVEVRLERAAGSARIRVTDCGEGISKEFLPFIFDRFRQADGTSTRRHGGLGLGLAIVRHLTELHGGAVYADSRGPGCGATFTIELPLTPVDQEAHLHKLESEGLWVEAPHDRQLKPMLSLEGIRVLLVDDDRDTLQLLSAILGEFRAQVETASRVEDALKVLQRYRPDVLVSDLAMPSEDGFSLIRKVRELEAQGGTRIAAVALTAYTRVEDRARALSAGFNIFVAKPFEPGELLTVIANLCETGSGESGWSQ